MTERAEELRRRRRESILEAAAGRFLVSGFDGTGMAAIAKDAGLSIGGVYRHFEHKEDIVAALIERDLERQLDRLRAAIDAVPASPPDEHVRAIVGALVAAQLPDREAAILGVEFCAAATRSPRLALLLEQHATQTGASIAAALPLKDPRHPVEVLLTLLDGLMVGVAVAGANDDALAAAGEEIADLVLLVVQAASA